jgi:hypothetical protein
LNGGVLSKYGILGCGLEVAEGVFGLEASIEEVADVVLICVEEEEDEACFSASLLFNDFCCTSKIWAPERFAPAAAAAVPDAAVADASVVAVAAVVAAAASVVVVAAVVAAVDAAGGLILMVLFNGDFGLLLLSSAATAEGGSRMDNLGPPPAGVLGRVCCAFGLLLLSRMVLFFSFLLVPESLVILETVTLQLND